MKYLMNPKVFKLIMRDLTHLKNDFTKINGNTYQEYITIILKNELNEKQKDNILNSSTEEEAIKLLDIYKINYSNEMT